jgi:hypothetical protein
MSNHQNDVDTMKEGFGELLTWARIIAMLPLEEWLNLLNRAESIGPIVDPTLFREYIYSDKPKILKSIIEAAIPLKRAVLAAQPAVVKEIERERK